MMPFNPPSIPGCIFFTTCILFDCSHPPMRAVAKSHLMHQAVRRQIGHLARCMQGWHFSPSSHWNNSRTWYV
jgi:hypothetical protein